MEKDKTQRTSNKVLESIKATGDMSSDLSKLFETLLGRELSVREYHKLYTLINENLPTRIENSGKVKGKDKSKKKKRKKKEFAMGMWHPWSKDVQ